MEVRCIEVSLYINNWLINVLLSIFSSLSILGDFDCFDFYDCIEFFLNSLQEGLIP